MPSFTLLGSKIIRFPFILHSSYPHELLHNWWGNSVYVDYQKGNWCEGLTAYLADHLIREQHGQGVDYRRTTLQGFTDYVNEKNDFPLNKFRSRYNASSASIGYGKSMMLFHMLRYQVGDKNFAQALQKFYVDNKFKNASFDDIRIAFEQITGKDFKDYFAQWVTRKGAPEIRLSNVKNGLIDGKYNLSFNLQQTQKGEPFELLIPVYIYFENEIIIKNVKMMMSNQLFEFNFDNPVLRIDIDPQYDVFRKLHFQEIPPTLSKAFGAKEILIILPSKASKELLDGYKTLASNWAKERSSSIIFKMDNEIEAFPVNKAVWLFGWENKFRNVVSDGVKTYKASAENNGFFVNGKNYSKDKSSIVISVRNPLNPSQVIVLMSADNRNAIPGLGRKLPHYGKYSYLAFEGDEPTNILKGQWIETSTPLNLVLNPDKIAKITKIIIPKRKPLANLAPAYSKEIMLETVKYLSSKKLKGRGIETDEIKIAGKYIADKFAEYGLKPGSDNNTFFQTWKQNIGKDNKAIEMRNVIGVIKGNKSGWENQAVIVCAHYDHLGTGERQGNADNKGKIHPGADDNASG
ncbi:MAG: M28 family peptidase, partial [Candidatus Heimdallarchaeota archaeon]|nr:M28 family peptidase [Candidatus Heimdallarchaeota archaeon]